MVPDIVARTQIQNSIRLPLPHTRPLIMKNMMMKKIVLFDFIFNNFVNGTDTHGGKWSQYLTQNPPPGASVQQVGVETLKCIVMGTAGV